MYKINLIFRYLKDPVDKQIILSYLLKGVGVAVSFFYVPLMLTYLSPAQFGLWGAITTVINWLRIFDIGVGNGLRFHLASAIAKGSYTKARELVSTTYAIMGGIFLCIWLLFLFVNPLINWQSLLNSTLISNPEYVKIMMIAVTSIISIFFLEIVKIIYAAHGDTATGNVLQIAGSIISLIGMYFLAFFTVKGQLDLAVAVVAVSPIVVYVIATVYTFGKKYTFMRPSFNFVNFRSSSELFNLSLKFFVVQITATIIYASIPFIITRFYGPESVAKYYVTNSIFNLPVMLIGLFTAPLIPFVTREYARDNLIWVRASLKRAMVLATIVSIGTIFFVILSPLIFDLWLGDKIKVDFQLSLLIGVYTIINVVLNPISSFMNAIGKINILVWLAPFGVAMFIGSCFLFDLFFHDVNAIVLALCINSLVGILVQPIVLKKYLWK